MTEPANGLANVVRRLRERRRAWLRSGGESFPRYLAQIGVLGWTIVLPTLAGVFIGRWIDRRLDTGIFWTGPSLLVGLGCGCWAAWRWMQQR
jgi:ATP synthase protein I